MEERKQLSVSEKNGILNELTKRGIHQDVVDLVKADLDFGLSQEQTQKYLSKKMDIRQMKVYSQCLRKGYPEEVLLFWFTSFLIYLNWFQCQGQFYDSRFNENEPPYLYANKMQTQHGRRICADHAVFIDRIFLILMNMLQ